TVPWRSHSSDAANIARWRVSHMAKCDEQARSAYTLLVEPTSVNAARIASGMLTGAIASFSPSTMSVGFRSLAATLRFQKNVGKVGTRRRPGAQLAASAT